MEDYLIQEMAEVQDKLWTLVGKKEIVLSLLDRFLRRKSGNRLLDAGCGCGLMLSGLKKYGEVSGLEYSEKAIELCRRTNPCEIKKGWLPDNLPYPADHFDAIIALDVIEHIEDDLAALKAIYGRLRPGGVAVVAVPANMALWSGHDVVHGHQRRYDLDQLADKLRSAGFKIKKISYYNTIMFLPILAIRVVNRLLKRDKPRSDAKLPPPAVNWLLTRGLLLEKLLLRYFNFRFGVALIAVAEK
ncbi:MAG: class I SAM-dependent methyltransferase [Candidatus Margulisbacteria bacterium]|nr:class I SAM-dependent methyltransferase [Candidatus Margulisiibacteriota bacterium]